MDNGNKRYDVVISDEATQMLVSHARFLAQVSGPAALRLIEVFQEKTKSLEEFPERKGRQLQAVRAILIEYLSVLYVPVSNVSRNFLHRGV